MHTHVYRFYILLRYIGNRSLIHLYTPIVRMYILYDFPIHIELTYPHEKAEFASSCWARPCVGAFK